MQRLGRSAVRLYSTGHAHALGDGINPRIKLTPGNSFRLNDGRIAVYGHHHDEGLHTSVLANGTRVISKDNGGDIAQLTVLFRDGPIYEDLFSAGASQFLRHLLSKDSVTSSEFVTKTFLGKAGVSVAVPELHKKSWLGYSCEGTRDTIAQTEVIDKYWQSILFPRFAASSVKEVKRLVQLENEETKRENPRLWTLDIAHKTAFKGSPLGQSEYCPGYNMKYFDSDKMFSRWDRHYGFKNIAVVATNIDHHQLVETLSNSVWVQRAHNKQSELTPPESKYVGGEGFELHRRGKEYDDQFVDCHNTHTVYAMQAPGMSNLSQWAATFALYSNLRKAASSVLIVRHQPPSEKEYSHGANIFYIPYQNVGLLGMATVGATAGQLKAFRDAIGKIASTDLDGLKNTAKLEVLMNDSSRGTQKMLIETFAACGTPYDATELTAAISKLTAADVKAAADRLLGTKATLVHYGDSPDAPMLSDL